MSNRTWVCFNCRRAVRRSPGVTPPVPCAECGNPCVNIGYKIPTPRRQDAAAWRALEDQLQREQIARARDAHRHEVELGHRIEAEITRLEQRPSSPGLERQIAQLRRQLDRLRTG